MSATHSRLIAAASLICSARKRCGRNISSMMPVGGSWKRMNLFSLLVGRLKEERVRDGSAGREKAAHHWLSAIDVVDAIVQDPTASAKHRLDGARELRQAATGSEANTPASDRDKFVININFGGHKLNKRVDLKPVRTEEELKLIERDEDNEDYERKSDF
jgi:hypothetical protein